MHSCPYHCICCAIQVAFVSKRLPSQNRPSLPLWPRKSLQETSSYSMSMPLQASASQCGWRACVRSQQQFCRPAGVASAHSVSTITSSSLNSSSHHSSACRPITCTSPHDCSSNSTEGRRAVLASAAAAAADGFADAGSSSHAHLLQQIQQFISAQYLPIALLCALTLGAVNPSLGLAASKMHIPALATFGIFVVQGLQLKRQEAMAALTAKREIAYGLLSILFITPLLGLLVAQLPLCPRPLAFGLGVVCTVPTALACGVAFVQQLGGNVSLALLLTVTSNILGIFTMPFILPHIAQAAALTGPSATTAQVVLEPLPLMLQLCQTILVPTLLGASIRGLIPGAAAAIDRHKKSLSYINAGLLASVPWMQISKTASQHMGIEAVAIAAMVAAAVAVHITFLTLNTLACRLFKLGGPDPVAAQAIRRALIISGSVKTLPVAVTVLTQLGPLLGEGAVGIAMLPVVAYQLVQIMWESVLVSRWLAADKLRLC